MSIKELIEEVNNLHRVNQSNYRIITEFNSIVIKLLQDKQELAAKLREERAKTSMIRGGFKDELDKPSDLDNRTSKLEDNEGNVVKSIRSSDNWDIV